MLDLAKGQFDNTLSVFSEADSGWQPDATSLTVAQQVAHVAQANEWFHHGLTLGFEAPFDSSKAGDAREVSAFTSLREARTWHDKAHAKLVMLVSGPSGLWSETFPAKPRFVDKPKWTALIGLVDHCAHHRGMLQAYARQMGKTNAPSLPYR